MKDIELLISLSIKTGKWLDISYLNNKEEVTYYWIAIKDIDLKKKKLYVSIFNDNKSLNTLDVIIKYDRIITARILEFTTYDTPKELIEKIETNREDASWLKYDSFNNNILRYYIKCSELDNDPYQKDVFLITGVDKEILLKKKSIILNNIQLKEVSNFIKNYDKKNTYGIINYFILSFLSIEESNKRYVVLYYDVRFNPYNKELTIIDIPRVNHSFLIQNKRHTLNNYIDISPQEFVDNITNNLNLYLKEYTELIRVNLNEYEIINQMPEFMILERNVSVNLTSTYNIIEERMENGKMEYPLRAFFGNCNRLGRKKKEPSIVLYDNKVNIDQMRVIYNSMKNPITYVQGPPGTGKTQTILNVILSAFFNSRTVLICSSNNKPIDGIMRKLHFSYKDDKDILFPFLRLGNYNEVLKATQKIIDLYNIDDKVIINDDVIDVIKRKSDDNNKDLINCLKNYEEKQDLKEKIDSATRMISSISNKNDQFYKNIEIELNKYKERYDSIDDISNDYVLSLVHSIDDNEILKDFLYMQSLKYISKLKNKKYSKLIEICGISDNSEKVTAFNNWCANDENIRLLEKVFPIILTTNISSYRLGSANHFFDLVIMDEAGQCNCATALLPISRAKQLLLVGDTNQLRPVIVLENTINELLKNEFSISDDYDYCSNSILDIMMRHDNISKSIMLSYHYRCGKKIINFSNKRFYEGKLNLESLTNDGELGLINIKNMNSKLRNENYEEANAIVDYVKRNNLRDTAIITPFKNQQNLINKMLKDNNIEDVSCGTIHQVQGAEKNTIIISSSISPRTSKKTFDWLKNNSEITNVAVTRAKKRLIVVNDVEALNKLSDKSDDLYNLVKYVYNNGEVEVLPNESYSIQIGKSNGSSNEDEFFKTITHFCSTNKNYYVKRNVGIADLFPDDKVLKDSNLEFDIVLYEVKDTDLIPRIIIELNGGEHFGNVSRERCDTRKSEICKSKGIVLLEVPNSFIKSYEAIKELILLNAKVQTEQLELF